MRLSLDFLMSRKIKINQIFLHKGPDRNPHKPIYDKYSDWDWTKFTKGRFDKRADPQRGITYHAKIKDRTPALFFWSNPFSENKKDTPWRDIIYQERGYVLYNGDNKKPTMKAYESAGNKMVMSSLLPLYHSKIREERLLAPPVIVTKTIPIEALQSIIREAFNVYSSFFLI